jgi:hypothetical protein
MGVSATTTTSATVAKKQLPGAKPESPWQKTPYPNLIRYVPSGTYFGRVKVEGKLIRRSLDTHVLEVAKLRLSDFFKDLRPFTTNGPAIKGEAIVELYRKEIDNDHRNTPRTKLYKREILIALKKAWPGFFDTDIARITQKDCREWAARYGRDYSPTRFNGALQIVRRLFALAIEEGWRHCPNDYRTALLALNLTSMARPFAFANYACQDSSVKGNQVAHVWRTHRGSATPDDPRSGNLIDQDLDSLVSVPGMAQSLQSSKPAKPVPRRSQKRPKSVRHSEFSPCPPDGLPLRPPGPSGSHVEYS